MCFGKDLDIALQLLCENILHLSKSSRARCTRQNKAFERYFRIGADDIWGIYQEASNSKIPKTSLVNISKLLRSTLIAGHNSGCYSLKSADRAAKSCKICPATNDRLNKEEQIDMAGFSKCFLEGFYGRNND